MCSWLAASGEPRSPRQPGRRCLRWRPRWQRPLLPSECSDASSCRRRGTTGRQQQLVPRPMLWRSGWHCTQSCLRRGLPRRSLLSTLLVPRLPLWRLHPLPLPSRSWPGLACLPVRWPCQLRHPQHWKPRQHLPRHPHRVEKGAAATNRSRHILVQRLCRAGKGGHRAKPEPHPQVP